MEEQRPGPLPFCVSAEGGRVCGAAVYARWERATVYARWERATVEVC